MHHAIPATGAERIELIDALRGFALAGVLLVNLRDLSLFSFLTEEARSAMMTAAWDPLWAMVMAALVEKKAITIFTLLFGVGFAMQMQSAARRDEGMHHYVRRLLILLAIGIIHGLFWHADVLRFYAVMGLFLVPMRRLSSRMLAGIGLLLSVFPWSLFQPMVDSFAPSLTTPPEISASTFAAFAGSSMWRMLKANFSYDLWLKVTQWSLPLAFLGRLLIGAAIGRSNVLREPKQHSRFWSRLLIFTLPIGAVATASVVIRDHVDLGTWSIQQLWSNETASHLFQISRNVASLSLGLAYIAVFVLLFQRPAWARWLNVLSPVGRMALTNYLLQTFLGLGLFYGFGLGIGPHLGLAGVSLVFPLIFGAQIALSHWWLARFNFGPVEWVWRSLTYGRLLPLRPRPAM